MPSSLTLLGSHHECATFQVPGQAPEKLLIALQSCYIRSGGLASARYPGCVLRIGVGKAFVLTCIENRRCRAQTNVKVENKHMRKGKEAAPIASSAMD